MDKSRTWQIFYRGRGQQLQVWKGPRGFFYRESEGPFSLSLESDTWKPIKSDYDIRVRYREDWDVAKSDGGEWIELTELIASPSLVEQEESAAFCHSLGGFWGAFVGRPRENVELPYVMAKNLQGELGKVTFFGGSFYPWHAGHRECLNLCPARDVIVVPDSNPWKSESEEYQKAQHHFWKYYVDLLSSLEGTEYALFPGFVGLPKGNPTVSWLPLFSCEGKAFLMGADTFLGFHHWKRVERLIQSLSTLYVASRLEDEKELQKQREQLMSRFTHLEIVFLGHHQFESLSSTELRKKMKS